MSKIRTLSLLLLGGAAACGSGARVTGDVNGYGFDLRTQFGWVDEKELKDQNGKMVYATRDEPRLFVRLSGASFDPEADVRFLSTNDLLALSQQESQHGGITFRVTKFNAVAVGQTISRPSNGADMLPQLDINYHFGLIPLAADAAYPPEVPVFGSRHTVTLTFTEVGRKANEQVEGSLEIAVETDTGDPSDARTGRIKVDFSAPLISERLAECNSSNQTNDNACEPDRPPGG